MIVSRIFSPEKSHLENYMITSAYRFTQSFVRQFAPIMPMKEVSTRLAQESVIVKKAEDEMAKYLQNREETIGSLSKIFEFIDNRPDIERFPTDGNGASLLEKHRMRFWRSDSMRPRDIGKLAQRTLNEMVKKDPSPGIAIELGCGNSGLVVELLKRNWTVVALDSSPHALNHLATRIHSLNLNDIAEKRLTYALQNMEDYEFPKNVNLVFGKNSFPFSKAEKFERLWDKIHGALKPDGYIGGNLWTCPRNQELEISQRQNASAWFADEPMTRAFLKDKDYDIVLLRQEGELLERSGNAIEFIGRKR